LIFVVDARTTRTNLGRNDFDVTGWRLSDGRGLSVEDQTRCLGIDPVPSLVSPNTITGAVDLPKVFDHHVDLERNEDRVKVSFSPMWRSPRGAWIFTFVRSPWRSLPGP